MCVCVYSNSRNDVPRVAQRFGTIASHTWRHVPVLVFVVFCVHMHSFASTLSTLPGSPLASRQGGGGGEKVSGLGHMSKMAAMPIYGKSLKIFMSTTTGPIALKHGM